MRGLWWRRRTDEIAEEIDAHLAMAARDHAARGLPPDEARRAALREFGNVPLIHQTTREVWTATALEQLLQDTRMGWRILRTAPGLSATAILLTALVIGGNTTIYAMVNSLLVSPAPGVTADRLVVLRHVERGEMLNDPFISFPHFADYRARTTTVAPLVAWSSERLTLATGQGNFALFGGLVTPQFFETLGVPMKHGRALEPRDDDAQDGVVAVISERVWRERFAAADDIVGRRAVVNQTPVTIVGVTDGGFAGALRTPVDDVWLPIGAYYRAIGGAEVLVNRTQPSVLVAGRLSKGSTLAAARAELATLLGQLQAAHPDSFTTYSGRAGRIPLRDPQMRVDLYSANALLPFADIAPRFLGVFSIVTLLTLLLVSANVANLLLGRAVQCQRDTAVRLSLGASHGRVLRLLIAEGLALAVTAWVAACTLAWWMSRALLRLIAPQPGFLDHARPDWTFLAYAMLLALLATVAFSVAPGVRAWRLQVLPLLKAGEHSVARGRSRLSNLFVVFQFALSVLLITSAGLALRSMSLFNTGDVGFDSNPMMLVTVRAGGAGAFVENPAGPAEQAEAFARLERVRERIAATGLVQSATYVRRVPGAYFNAATPVWRDDRDGQAHVYVRTVGPDYFRTLGLSVLAGRELTAVDRRGAPRAAVVNETLARELFGTESPLGRTVRMGASGDTAEIVGVAPNARVDGAVHKREPRYLFIAEQQLSSAPPTDPTFVVRHRSTLDAVAPLVTRAIADVNSALPIVRIATMNERLAEVTVFEETLLQFLLYFAGVSLLIAALGQYAVATFNMRRRTRDFGVRLALGASTARIHRDVLRDALRLSLLGVLAGFGLAAVTATFAQDVLFGITPADPLTYTAVFLLLLLVSLVASFVPAWRAGRVNVVDALRTE